MANGWMDGWMDEERERGRDRRTIADCILQDGVQKLSLPRSLPGLPPIPYRPPYNLFLLQPQ
jgi:hypothetical protein